MKFKDLLIEKDGMIKGPFGSAVKKSLFVPKSDDTYKVYEQSVVASHDFSIGNYYLPKNYVDEKLKRFFIKPGDILMTGAGTLGLLSQVPEMIEPGIMNQALIRIRLDENIIDKSYFMYYFPWAIKDIACRMNGDSVIPNLPPLDKLKAIEVEIPTLKKQQQIAKRLDFFNEKINNNNKIISELESIAKTIYDYWFLQFEFPNEDGKPYKSSGGKMVWNEELKREIPEGWEVKQLCSICDFVMGQSPKGKSYNVNGIGYPLINGAVELSKNGITIDKYSDEANRLSSVGDWLFCIRATIGNVQMSDKQYALGRGVAGAHPKNKKYTEYLYMIIVQMCEYFSKILVGSIIAGMTKDDISNHPVVIPPEETISEFHTILSNSFIKKECLKQENQELASLRDFLLPMLMNGQVTFKD